MNAISLKLTKSQLLLLELIKNLGGEIDDKTKLAKLQYFSDFIHYAFHDQAISEPENYYQRRRQGPLSRTFNDDLGVLCGLGLLEKTGEYSFKVGGTVGNQELSHEEQKTVRFVASRYGESSWRELCKIAHSQIPYLSASGEGAVIEYFTAYNLVDEYPDYAKFTYA